MQKNHLNELTPGLLYKAAASQRKRFKDENYLKSISAYDYIKQLQRASDFQDYADEIVDKINSGNINDELPEDRLPKETVALQQASEEEPQISQEAKDEIENAEPVPAVSIQDRKQEIKKAPAELKFQKHPSPIVNMTSDWESLKKGDYVVTYISNLDDDIASVIIEASSKKNASSEIIRQFWDVQEIVAVVLLSAYDENNVLKRHPKVTAGSSDGEIINPDNYASSEALANACASVVSGGEFNNYNELVADMKDDETTEETADGDMYVGETTEGEQWHGGKSSVRMICENENFDWAANTLSADDYRVEIVTEINPDGNDRIITAAVNAHIMRKALSEGIVHIVFTKQDGSERQAFATTNNEILEENHATPNGKGSNMNVNENQIRFFDMTIRQWRSFVMERLTMIYDESY